MRHTLRIALVEDDLDLLHSTVEFLAAMGFHVWGEPSAEAFYRRFPSDPVDVVVLDIGLPGEDGLSVASLLRANRNLAVIILSARDALEDRLAGLRAGADRYMVKPVNLLELAANIDAVGTRLAPSTNGAVLELPRTTVASKAPSANSHAPAAALGSRRWSLSIDKWLLTAPDGKTLQLSSREYVVLHKLIENQGQVVLRKDLINALFGTRNINGDERFNVLLARLRKKVLKTLQVELPLKTAHLVGYAFVEQGCLIER